MFSLRIFAGLLVVASAANASFAQGPTSSTGEPTTLPPLPVTQNQPEFLTHEQQVARLAVIQNINLKGDRAKVPYLIENLDRKKQTEFYLPSLHALGRLEATDALPAIEEFIGRETAPSRHRADAKAVRARLLAERAARLASTNKTQIKVTTFLHEVGLSASEISEKRPNQNRYPSEVSYFKAVALRELADIAYNHHDGALIEEAKRQGVDFTGDAPAELKARFAASSSLERISGLLDDLASRDGIKPILYFTIQLVGNEGVDASRAAADRIRFLLNTQGSQQADIVGLGPLLAVITCVGNSNQIPFVEELTRSSNPYVRNWARPSLMNLKHGQPFPYAPGF